VISWGEVQGGRFKDIPQAGVKRGKLERGKQGCKVSKLGTVNWAKLGRGNGESAQQEGEEESRTTK